jgi:phosphinothricin acetyltransferase
MGFRLVGVYQGVGHKFGQWLDVAWYQTSLQPERPNPASPLQASALDRSSDWADALREGLTYYRPRRV